MIFFHSFDLFFLAFAIVSLALLFIILLNAEQRTLVVINIIITLCGGALSTSSFIVNHLEIGGQYAGLLMGFTNCAGAMPGFIIPLLVGQLVPDTHVRNN